MPAKGMVPTKPRAVKTPRGRPRKIVAEGALVDAALRVMEREGYAALTIRSLAKELGAGPSTLYNYFERIEDIEAQALDRLTSQLPMPMSSSPLELRAELVAYLLAALRLLMQHPGVLFPPIGSPSAKKLNVIGERWVQALIQHAPDEKTARLALGALVSTIVVHAERARIYGPKSTAAQRVATEHKGLSTTEEIVDAMLDLVLPGLKRNADGAPRRSGGL